MAACGEQFLNLQWKFMLEVESMSWRVTKKWYDMTKDTLKSHWSRTTGIGPTCKVIAVVDPGDFVGIGCAPYKAHLEISFLYL